MTSCSAAQATTGWWAWPERTACMAALAPIFSSLPAFRIRRRARDHIDDFTHAEGDRIDLVAIDADSLADGNQAFTYIGEQSFSGTAGELRWLRTADATYVQADVNGDRVADLAIIIGKSIDLHASDFLL